MAILYRLQETDYNKEASLKSWYYRDERYFTLRYRSKPNVSTLNFHKILLAYVGSRNKSGLDVNTNLGKYQSVKLTVCNLTTRLRY
jgi:hypothetical protein